MSVGDTSSLVLFLNASAGSGEADKLLDLWHQTVPEARLGPVFTVRDTAKYDEELEQALIFCETSQAVLVVAGGDGTFIGVLRRAGPKNITLGLIPTGTFNFFARSHGIPEEPEAAIESLLSAKPVTLPLAYVNDRPFIVSVSMGMHPAIIAEREVHTRYVGRTRFAAWLSGIWTILRARHLVRVIVWTERWRKQMVTPLLLINFNSAQLLGLDDRFRYQPEKLALLRLKKTSIWSILVLIVHGLSRHVLDEDSLECEYASELSIETRPRSIRIVLDGELVHCQSPMKFRVQKQAFSCLLA